MPELPDGMMQRDRPIDDVFKPDEPLYRRVPHEFWDEDRYPHSEVQAFYSKAAAPEFEEHVDKEFLKREQLQRLDTLFPDELQLRWREQLRRKCRIVLQAHQSA